MAQLTKKKRDRITALILDTMGALDKTGANRTRYLDMLKGMSDEQFDRFVRAFRSDDNHFYLEVVPYKNEPELGDIEKAAKIVGVPLHEHVYFRHNSDQPVRSREKVPVGYVYIRRLQQILKKKTGFSLDTDKRSQVTGQLVGDSAAGRLADEETYALIAMGAKSIAQELLGPRADNRDKRLQMYQSIDRDGFVSLGSLRGDLKNQPTLNFLNSLLIGAGLSSDLVDPTELLRVTGERGAQQAQR